MVATVGSIAIELSTNTHQFTDGFKKAATTVERQSARMSKAMVGIGNAMRGFAGGIVAGIGVGALTNTIKQIATAMGELEDIGNRAKASGLGTEFFQAIAFGAAEADVETETLNTSLAIFAKNMGLAQQGAGALYAGLSKLNPELLRAVLTAQDQEERLKLVADAMSRMTDATEKAALATTVFGRGGADMVRVLDGGRESLDKMVATARRLGIVISESAIKKAGELDDELTRQTQIINTQWNTALVNMGPILLRTATGVAHLTGQVAEASNKITAFANNPSWKTLLNLFPELTEEERKLKDTIAKAAGATEVAARSFADIQTDLLAAYGKLNELFALAEEGVEVNFDIGAALDNIGVLEAELVQFYRVTSSAAKAVRADLAQAFRASEIASMEAAGLTPRTLPTVTRYGEEDEIVDAIDEETGATRDVYHRIDRLDSNTAGYFDRLGGTVSYNFQNLQQAVDTLGAGVVALASSFRFQGFSQDSWEGRRLTFRNMSPPEMLPGMSMANLLPGNLATAATDQPIAPSAGEAGTVNVSVVVKPVLEGTRLSAQSAAEIKQAASAGANAALRSFYGR
jgi:hypothetical protein